MIILFCKNTQKTFVFNDKMIFYHNFSTTWLFRMSYKAPEGQNYGRYGNKAPEERYYGRYENCYFIKKAQYGRNYGRK